MMTFHTFVAPASVPLPMFAGGRLYANCSLTSVTYQIRTASGAIRTDFGYKHGIAHNAPQRARTPQTSAYMTCTVLPSTD